MCQDDKTKDLEGGQSSKRVKGDTMMPHNGVLVSKKLTVVLEGPYGLPSIDVVSGFYSVFMLIGGGIGEKNSLSPLAP
jgi:hypothetical protein